MHVTPWRIELLGMLRASRGARSIERFSTHKTAALLARLAFYVGRAHPREELVEWLWPDDYSLGAQSLRQSLVTLRRLLEPADTPHGGVVIATRASVHLNGKVIQTDVAEFDSIVKSTAAQIDSDLKAALVSRAVGLYRGELLPGFYDDWVIAQRGRLSSAYAAAIRQLVDWHLATGDYDVASEHAHRWLACDPVDEYACLAAMQAEAALGRFATALRLYNEYRDLLFIQLATRARADYPAASRPADQSKKRPQDTCCLNPAQTGPSHEYRQRFF